MNENVPELSFGKKAVGLTFNPSNKTEVDTVKCYYAGIIDMMDNLRKNTDSKEVQRLASIAITEAQTAQMWAVKALTWKD